VNLRRHHGAGVKIDGVFRLVRQVRRPVLHPGDLGVGIGPASAASPATSPPDRLAYPAAYPAPIRAILQIP
jgi:hypothetical protein